MHPAIQSGHLAVVTGGASGIGLAAARTLAGHGLTVVIVDLAGDRLEAARADLIAGGVAADRVATIATDVGDADAIAAMRDRVLADFGVPHVVMNNAGMQSGSSIFDEQGNWDRIVTVNMWGVVRGAQAFAPAMIAADQPGLIVNTGSKQGITTPPGDPAYNLSKAGVKVFTEALEHALRNIEGCQVEAKLFVPGFVFTPLTAQGRAEKPDGAWTPEQTVEFLFASIDNGDFYILCPDGEVDRPTDAKRIAWAAGDITENRPPLSRWHPDFGDAFADWLKQ